MNPRIRVLLAQLINSSKCPPAPLNAKLPALVDEKNSMESPIVLVDQYSGFDPSTMTCDGIHPNDVGDSWMADRWFEKLAPTLNIFSTLQVRYDEGPTKQYTPASLNFSGHLPQLSARRR